MTLDSADRQCLRLLDNFLPVCTAVANWKATDPPANVLSKPSLVNAVCEDAIDREGLQEKLARILSTPENESVLTVTEQEAVPQATASSNTILSQIGVAPRPNKLAFLPVASSTEILAKSPRLDDIHNSRDMATLTTKFLPSVGWCTRTQDQDSDPRYQVLFLDGVSLAVNVGDGSVTFTSADGVVNDSSGSRATPLAADLTQDALHDLRRASSQRVLSIWESLAERYAKALDEDDIVDLRHGILVKDRGVVRSKEKMPIGYFAGDDQEEVASTAGPEGRDTAEEEAGTDMDPLDAFAPDDSVPKEFELEKDRRKVPPVQVLDPMDADDLKEFLEAEKQRREVCGVDEEDEDEDALDVVEALENGGWETTDGEDLVGSEEGDSEASDLPPSDVDPAPSEPIRRVQAERALTIADGSDSEDELLKWSDDEAFVVPRTQPFNADFIDLTTPSPPSSPIKPDQPKSSTKARTPSTAPSHAKSKTPAARRVAVTVVFSNI
ncbi:hypothetical protein EUX98_g6193 [Antrodiella citrinella]|uniref:Uncharacterized protein n=1 Tax=Antrodiella citrinella TaxID=2447956 RepID=A0A4S4MPK7_9APHY|nr:hypothetical protein EUX98_g6193 [Antrodiella citrinella]